MGLVILWQQPLTVIDPNPIVNLSVLDFGRSLLLMISGGVSKEAEMNFKGGYFEEGSHLDDSVIQAAIVLNAYLKFSYWKAKEKNEEIERVQQFLAENRHLLGLNH